MGYFPNAAISVIGGAVPSYAEYVGFNSGGNLTGVSASTPLPIEITNGTNVASVKAASAAATSLDPAVVVAISPNNTVGVTQSTVPWSTQDYSTGLEGTTEPLYATYIGGTNGPYLQGINVDSTGNLILSDSGGLADWIKMLVYELRAVKHAIIQTSKAGPVIEKDYNSINFVIDYDQSTN